MSDETRIPFRFPELQKAVDLFRIQANKTYSTTVGHIELVKEMASRRHVKEAVILREAIELLWELQGKASK